MANFGNLPVELIDAILYSIIRPSDLKALCLVSNTISEPAFQHLYRNIALPHRIDDRNWTRLDCLSSSRHLHCIQSIDIGRSHLSRIDILCKNLQPLLQKLPTGALKGFRYGLHGRPQAEDLMTIWRDHKGLKNLQLDFNIYAPPLWELIQYSKADLSLLTSIEDIEVDFGQEDDEDSTLALFDLLPLGRLRTLKLLYAGINDDTAPRRVHTFSRLGVALASRDVLMRLTSISLCAVCLPPPEDWDLRKYHALTAVEFIECQGVAPILDSLEKPTLKCFHIESRSWPVTESTYQSTKLFLQRFGTLEALTVDIDTLDKGERLVPAIQEHSLQLKSLCVDGYSDAPGPRVIHKHLGMCTKLKYLALRLRVDILMVDRCKHIFRQLPQLEFLLVRQYSASTAESPHWYNKDVRPGYAQQCATKIFSHVPAGGRLRLLGFTRVSGRAGFQSEVWHHYFIQAKDEKECTSRLSLGSASDKGISQEGEHTAVELDRGLVRYMFPDVDARFLE